MRARAAGGGGGPAPCGPGPGLRAIRGGKPLRGRREGLVPPAWGEGWLPALGNRPSFGHRGEVAAFPQPRPGRGGPGREAAGRESCGGFHHFTSSKSVESSFPERWMLNYLTCAERRQLCCVAACSLGFSSAEYALLMVLSDQPRYLAKLLARGANVIYDFRFVTFKV